MQRSRMYIVHAFRLLLSHWQFLILFKLLNKKNYLFCVYLSFSKKNFV